MYIFQLHADNLALLYFSHFISSKNYAVQLEKVTSRQFRDKGRQHSESYFQFPNWESPAWEKTKKEFGEGLNPIDKIESKNWFNYKGEGIWHYIHNTINHLLYYFSTQRFIQWRLWDEKRFCNDGNPWHLPGSRTKKSYIHQVKSKGKDLSEKS